MWGIGKQFCIHVSSTSLVISMFARKVEFFQCQVGRDVDGCPCCLMEKFLGFLFERGFFRKLILRIVLAGVRTEKDEVHCLPVSSFFNP